MTKQFKRLQANTSEVKVLYGDVRVLSGSAGTAVITGSGFSSISRVASGSYQIVLSDQWSGLKMYDFKLTSPTSGTIVPFVLSSTGSSVNTSEKSVNLCVRQISGSVTHPANTGAGALSDPNQTFTALIRLDLKNSSVTP